LSDVRVLCDCWMCVLVLCRIMCLHSIVGSPYITLYNYTKDEMQIADMQSSDRVVISSVRPSVHPCQLDLKNKYSEFDMSRFVCVCPQSAIFSTY